MAPGGYEHSAACCDGKDYFQVITGFRSIQDDESNSACQGSLRRFQRALAGIFAISPGYRLQGLSCLRLMVEGMKEDAVRESLGRIVFRRKLPDSFRGQGCLAHAAWTADGDHLAGLQVFKERRKLLISSCKMLDSWRLLQWKAKLGSLLINERSLELAGKDWTLDIASYIGLRVLYHLAAMVYRGFVVHN
jgi:hypothetical protein